MAAAPRQIRSVTSGMVYVEGTFTRDKSTRVRSNDSQ